ncbi:hypothetical protein [Halonatronum saccharophilum]|uniref:hypothetical protein n=1 Tax=Halonatronum saccharophilum TaxID=150060 RepID=UPI000488672F|nr:hypothetical protein [Halonatronum saccharophilum]
MINFKELNLQSYSEEEIIFKSRRDLISAIEELSNGNDIVISYPKDNKLRSIVLMNEVMVKFRNGDIALVAEEELK